MKTLKIKTVDISQKRNHEIYIHVIEDIVKDLGENQEGIFLVRGDNLSLIALALEDAGADVSIIPVCYGNGKKEETNVKFRSAAIKFLYQKYIVMTGKRPAKSWDRSKTFLKWLEQIDYTKTDYVILNTN